MNIQTEPLENRVARITVEIEPEQFEQAKQRAIRKVAQQVSIPGFRKGKVPYSILVQHGLEEQIVMETFESLYLDVYKTVLEQSTLDPYGPGSFEKYELNPPKLIYTVPLQPIVTLGDYQSVRLDYQSPEVADDAVDRALKTLQEQRALVEDSVRPVALGCRVRVDIHAEFVDEARPDVANSPAKGEVFTDVKNLPLRLDPAATPILPGFSEALVGANVDDTVIFRLVVPDDAQTYVEDAGRELEFKVTVHQVETITIPVLNDDFAARFTAEWEDGPLTLLQLRVRVRENLQKEAEQQAKSEYTEAVLTQIVAGAAIDFPLVMIDDQIEALLEDLDERLKRQKITRRRYLDMIGQTEEQLREGYRALAADMIKRALVLREIVRQNQFTIADQQVDAHIETLIPLFGDQSERIRTILNSPESREEIKNRLLNERVLDYIAALGKGESIVITGGVDEAAAAAPIVAPVVVETAESDDAPATPAETNPPA